MITSAQMLKSAREEIDGIKGTIAEIGQKQQAGEISQQDAVRNISNLQGFISKIEHDITVYESLKSGSAQYINPQKLEDIPETITQLRILYDWSQGKLAYEIGVKQQQIARYESTDYEGISFQRMLGLLEAFDAYISIERIRLNISGKPVVKFKLPEGISVEGVLHLKKSGLFNQFSET